ncbi:hypothetical protein [Sphingomonas endolithica]|uniref:hypothetical protein n=1 Tax=Sphingomonas endolithica TaxID=2972485 RepID=UPI0021B07CA9|nr:hypothetical protein [Sphingomonas sp. ZFBP2030]
MLQRIAAFAHNDQMFSRSALNNHPRQLAGFRLNVLAGKVPCQISSAQRNSAFCWPAREEPDRITGGTQFYA